MPPKKAHAESIVSRPAIRSWSTENTGVRGRIHSKGKAGAVYAEPSDGDCASASRGGRTGSRSPLAPATTVSSTGVGDGQIQGQYVVEMATRRRCPAGTEYPTALSGTVTP